MAFFSAFLIPLLTGLATSAGTIGLKKLIGGPDGNRRLSDVLGGKEKGRDKKIPLSGESTAAAIQQLKPATSLLPPVDPTERERRLNMLRNPFI